MKQFGWVCVILTIPHLAAAAPSPSITICGPSPLSPALQEMVLADLVDGYVVPPFDHERFRDAISQVSDTGLILRLFERVERHARNVLSQREAIQFELLRLSRFDENAPEPQKRRWDAQLKRISIGERRLATLDSIHACLIGAMELRVSDMTWACLLDRYFKLTPRTRGLVLELAALHAVRSQAAALSLAFCGESDPELIEKFLPVLARVQGATDDAVIKLCSLAADFKRTRWFRHACMQTVAAVGTPAAVPFLNKLLEDPVVGSKAFDAYRRITGINPFDKP